MSKDTIRNLRKSGGEFSPPEKRIGRDGKMQAAKKKGVTRPAKPDEIGEDGFKAGRRIDLSTGVSPQAPPLQSRRRSLSRLQGRRSSRQA